MKTWQCVTISYRGAMNPLWLPTTLGDFLNRVGAGPGEVLVLPATNESLCQVLVFTDNQVEGASIAYPLLG